MANQNQFPLVVITLLAPVVQADDEILRKGDDQPLRNCLSRHYLLPNGADDGGVKATPDKGEAFIEFGPGQKTLCIVGTGCEKPTVFNVGKSKPSAGGLIEVEISAEGGLHGTLRYRPTPSSQPIAAPPVSRPIAAPPRVETPKPPPVPQPIPPPKPVKPKGDPPPVRPPEKRRHTGGWEKFWRMHLRASGELTLIERMLNRDLDDIVLCAEEAGEDPIEMIEGLQRRWAAIKARLAQVQEGMSGSDQGSE